MISKAEVSTWGDHKFLEHVVSEGITRLEGISIELPHTERQIVTAGIAAFSNALRLLNLNKLRVSSGAAKAAHMGFLSLGAVAGLSPSCDPDAVVDWCEEAKEISPVVATCFGGVATGMGMDSEDKEQHLFNTRSYLVDEVLGTGSWPRQAHGG